MTQLSDVGRLAQELIRIDSCNPPGVEALVANLIARRLRAQGIEVELHSLSPGRDSLIARVPGRNAGSALCLSGHLDTVPVGNGIWSTDPFSGAVEGDRLWGRGASDMKGAVAAMVVALERLNRLQPSDPVILVLTASEETGCQGAAGIADKIGPVRALVVGEPTGQNVVIGHKGVLWLRLTAFGRAAHGSRPDLGENAIDKMIDALVRARTVSFSSSDTSLGWPTTSLGTIAGGAAINIVPDRCHATVDIRMVPGMCPGKTREALRRALGPDIDVETTLSLDPVYSEHEDPWITHVHGVARDVYGASSELQTASLFSDASVFCRALGYPPVLLIGPGNPALAHQTNEWCSLEAIERAADLYTYLGRHPGEIATAAASCT